MSERQYRDKIASIKTQQGVNEAALSKARTAAAKYRADAAKDYLVRLGLAASRISTVSNGKEKPRAPGHDEQSWSENRRSDVG